MNAHRRIFRWLPLAAAGWLALSCASTPKKEEPIMTVEEFERNTPPPPDPCLEKGEPRECESNEDCCEGYVCTRDPDRSAVLKYCLEG
jgi:hypothetical protein